MDTEAVIFAIVTKHIFKLNILANTCPCEMYSSLWSFQDLQKELQSFFVMALFSGNLFGGRTWQPQLHSLLPEVTINCVDMFQG